MVRHSFLGLAGGLPLLPITYAGIPAILAYLLLFGATAAAGFFFFLFGGILSVVLKRFGYWGLLLAPFVWIAVEFARLWLTGNIWNSIGYSQAFTGFARYASIGGVFLVGFLVIWINSIIVWAHYYLKEEARLPIFSTYIPKLFIESNYSDAFQKIAKSRSWRGLLIAVSLPILTALLLYLVPGNAYVPPFRDNAAGHVVAVQPNVPMEGLTQTKWRSLRKRHVALAENALLNPNFYEAAKRQAEFDASPGDVDKRTRFYEELAVESFRDGKKLVVFPESPMNFQYELDEEFRDFVSDFATRNDVSVLFNSAERDRSRKRGFFNSAVMVDNRGAKAAQYDKILFVAIWENLFPCRNRWQIWFQQWSEGFRLEQSTICFR